MLVSGPKDCVTPKNQPVIARPVRPLLWALLCVCSSTAWAYKVEKVCTDIAATASEPAKKICKIVRKTEEKEAPKEEKKEEKKKH